MRIVFVTREGYESAGARVRCYNFARMLNDAGVDASVFSFADRLGAKCGEKEFEMTLWQKLWLNIKALGVLGKERKETIYILQRVNYHVLAPLLLVVLKRGRYILDCDDWDIRENPVYHFGFYPSSKMEYLTRLVARKALLCIVASSYLQDYFKSFNARVHLIPTGVDHDVFVPCVKADLSKVVFSWIGTAYHQPMGENLQFILDCFFEIADQDERVILSLAGEGRYFEIMKGIVAGHRHRDKVVLSDWILSDQIPGHLAGIDVGLLPLIQKTKFNQAKSPTKLFEYMSMGKPVVASRIGEAARSVRHGQTGFLAENKTDFISCMRLLVDNASLRREMGRAARDEVVFRYSLKSLGTQLVDIVKIAGAST
ncbi:MAG: glycosyltransferase family 4 protein [Candidatus Omnitrophota bacterium]